MAWTAPPVFTVGQELLSVTMNAFSANMTALAPQSNGPTYASFTPPITADGGSPALGNGTISSRFQQIGKGVHFYGTLVIGSTTSLGTGNFYVGLPVTAAASIGGFILLGNVTLLNGAGTATATGSGFQVGTTKFYAVDAATYHGTTEVWSGNAPSPFTYTTGTNMYWNLLFEAA